MLVNINEEVLQVLKLNDLEETEDNKQIIENVVNSYLVGGIYTAIQQGNSDFDKEKIEELMKYYAVKMLDDIIDKILGMDK